MAHPLKTVAVTSDAWSEPVLINEADFDHEVHTKVTEDGKPARKRGRPSKPKESEDNANG